MEKRIMKEEEARQLLYRLINSGVSDVNKFILNSSSSTQGTIITALQDYKRKLDDLVIYLKVCQFPEEVEVSKYDK